MFSYINYCNTTKYTCWLLVQWRYDSTIQPPIDWILSNTMGTRTSWQCAGRQVCDKRRGEEKREKIYVKWAQTMGSIYRVRMNFDFLKNQFFWSSNGQKAASFSIQQIKFVFKRSNLNLNRPIPRWHLATAHRLQRRAVPTGQMRLNWL
jgi:hypothetical protein